MSTNLTLSRTLAPEDIAIGTYVAVLTETVELPAFLFCDIPATDPSRGAEVVRIDRKPESAGLPLRVMTVCLPFVLVEDDRGRVKTLDLRSCRLTLLDERYAQVVRARRQRQRAEKRIRKAEKRKRERSEDVD